MDQTNELKHTLFWWLFIQPIWSLLTRFCKSWLNTGNSVAICHATVVKWPVYLEKHTCVLIVVLFVDLHSRAQKSHEWNGFWIASMLYHINLYPIIIVIIWCKQEFLFTNIQACLDMKLHLSNMPLLNLHYVTKYKMKWQTTNINLKHAPKLEKTINWQLCYKQKMWTVFSSDSW